MSDNTEKAEQIFESARDMMDSIKSVKGEQFALTVEIALQMMKLRDINGMLLDRIDMSEEDRQRIYNGIGIVCAHVTSLAANLSEIDKAEDAKELMNWAEKLLDLEVKGAITAIGEAE